MSYHYGGIMPPEQKKKIAKRVLATVCALAVFAGFPSAYARIHYYIYHLPSVDPGIVEDASDPVTFNWDEVKGTVDEGLKRYEENERKQYGSNYYVDKGSYNHGKNYMWESYEWDYDDYRRTISYFNFDTVGGTIITYRRYGFGDWKSHHPGDDFAMYSHLFSHTIPIRDMVARAEYRKLEHRNDNMIDLTKKIAETKTSRVNTNTDKGVQGFFSQMTLNLGSLKDIMAKIKDPEKFLNGIEVVIQAKETSPNPETPFGGYFNGYSNDAMHEGRTGKIAMDKIKYMQDSNNDSMDVYNKALEDLEGMQDTIEKLGKKDANGTEDRESLTSAKQREEALQRINLAMKEQMRKVNGVEARRQTTAEQTYRDWDTIQHQYEKQRTHMPTAKEYKKEIAEKKVHSTSRDLGWQKLDTSGKADFGSILNDTVFPDFDTSAKQPQEQP